MKIEEAIVYVLAARNGGMKTDQIAEVINRERLTSARMAVRYLRLLSSGL